MLDLDLPERCGEIEDPAIGYKLIQYAHQLSKNPAIIVHSAFSDVDHVVESFRSGVSDFIAKPYSSDELRLRALNAIARSQRHEPNSQQASRFADKVRSKVFLSYAIEDRDQVRNIYRKLQEVGLCPWMDVMDILPGEDWDYCITNAIRTSDFIVIFLSEKSVKKRGYIRKEVAEALSSLSKMRLDDIFLIPAWLEKCAAKEGLPDELQKRQWVNLFEESGWERLLDAIQEGIARRQS